MPDNTLQLTIDGVPYEIRISPFSFNDALRYNVIINRSSEYVFAYDSNVGQFIAIDEDSGMIPQNVETTISGRLMGFAEVK